MAPRRRAREMIEPVRRIAPARGVEAVGSSPEGVRPPPAVVLASVPRSEPVKEERPVPVQEIAANDADFCPPDPQKFGQFLQHAREARGLSLDDVSHQTKIRRAILEALEHDNRRELPEKVFVLGYVRSYSAVVGISVEDAVRRCQEAWIDDEEVQAEAAAQAKARSWAWVPTAVAVLIAVAALVFIVRSR